MSATVNEIVKDGLVHYALATGFEAGCLSPKQSDFYNFYQHAALTISMALASGEIDFKQRMTVLNPFFDRVYGKYGKWADDVIDTVRKGKNEKAQIRGFDTYYIASMRDPYAECCKPNQDTLNRISKHLDACKASYQRKNAIVKELTKKPLAIFM